MNAIGGTGVLGFIDQRKPTQLPISTAAQQFRERFDLQLETKLQTPVSTLPLSFRDVEEILARRGGVLSYETVQMCLSLGQSHANDLRRRRSQPVDHRYLDEVVLKIEVANTLRTSAKENPIHYLLPAVRPMRLCVLKL